jgi:hypothetical protein
MYGHVLSFFPPRLMGSFAIRCFALYEGATYNEAHTIFVCDAEARTTLVGLDRANLFSVSESLRPIVLSKSDSLPKRHLNASWSFLTHVKPCFSGSITRLLVSAL